MDSKQIEAIRARDQSPYMKATTWLSQSEGDRRALLSAYDALRSRLAEAEAALESAEKLIEAETAVSKELEARLAEAEALLRDIRVHADAVTRHAIDAFLAPDSAEAAADVFAAMNLPTHTFPSITSSAHKPGCAVFSVSPFRAQRPDCDCGADLAAADQENERE